MNDKAYIHEFIDIRGHHRADYMQHMAANWSPLAQRTRGQRCFGVWAVLGSTGPWPQVVNLWEEDGFAGLAASFEAEAVGLHAQLGAELVGAFRTAMVDDDEVILLWALPTWGHWAALEVAHEEDRGLRDWIERSRELVRHRHRILLVDAPLAPLRTGRQPSVDDRTDWVD